MTSMGTVYEPIPQAVLPEEEVITTFQVTAKDVDAFIEKESIIVEKDVDYPLYEDIVNVKLISYSQPSIWKTELRGNDIFNLIAYCARVSNPNNQSNTDTSEKLIKYLAKYKHWSPFEMANICLELTTTRDIARQILRHRSFSFQEYSQRYADPTKDLEFCIKQARSQDSKNRQNSIDDLPENIKLMWKQMQIENIENSLLHYEFAINSGIAKECARVVLPEGNTVSRLYMNGTIRSWIHYLEVRLEEGVQLEHKVMAKGCAEAISTVFPLINTFTPSEGNS